MRVMNGVMMSREVLQPVEGRCRDERLLVAERQEDRGLDLGQPPVEVLRVILLQFRPML